MRFFYVNWRREQGARSSKAATISFFLFAASWPYLAYKLTELITWVGSVPAAAGTQVAVGLTFLTQIYSFFKCGF